MSEMDVGDEREIYIRYSWPKYWAQLLNRGSTIFSFTNGPQSDSSNSKLIYKWRFEKLMPKVIATEISETEPSNRITNKVINGKQEITLLDEVLFAKGKIKFELIGEEDHKTPPQFRD